MALLVQFTICEQIKPQLSNFVESNNRERKSLFLCLISVTLHEKTEIDKKSIFIMSVKCIYMELGFFLCMWIGPPCTYLFKLAFPVDL